MPSTRRCAPIRLSIAVFAAAALLLSACAPAAQAPAVIASAVPVTGGNGSSSAGSNSAAAPTATQAAGSSIPETVTPAVKVSDQAVSNGTVTVDSVTSPGPGWIVIHINSGGSPGQIIGWSAVKPGVNQKVQVNVDASKVTPVMYAMLHVDAGTVGTYEFPGPDKPIMFNGQMVSPAFAVTGGAGGSGTAGGGAAAPTATTGAAAQAANPTATSAPAQAAASQPTATTAAASGGYSYGSSATATPAASGSSGSSGSSSGAASSGPATVSVANNPKLGNILVDSKGMTLYIFKKDTPGASNCTGGCLENWPPLLITSGKPSAGAGVTGALSQLTRSDNGVQVMYNNQPLYYFAGDKAPGDVNGQGIGNSWFAATP